MAYPDSFPNIQYGTSADISAIAEVRRLLNEPIARDFTDTQIQAWIDRGAVEAARLTKLVETGNTYITLGTGISEYAVGATLYTAPQDSAIEIEELFYCGQSASTPQKAQGGYALTKIDMATVGHLPNNTAGAPHYWAIRNTANNNRSVYIYPAPAAGQNLHVVEVLWVNAANSLKAADTSTTHYLREFIREAVYWYAVGEAHKKLRRYDIAEMYHGIFRNLLMFHRSDKHPKPVDSRSDMTVPDYTQYR